MFLQMAKTLILVIKLDSISHVVRKVLKFKITDIFEMSDKRYPTGRRQQQAPQNKEFLDEQPSWCSLTPAEAGRET